MLRRMYPGGGCCKQWWGNSSIQKRAGNWARVNFRKDVWDCYYETGWGGGGWNLAKRLSLLRCSCFQILISNHFQYICQVWVHRTVLTKHLLIWSMMVFMICEMIWAKDTMRKMRQKRYDSTAWLVSQGWDTPPEGVRLGDFSHQGPITGSEQLPCARVTALSQTRLFLERFGANFESYKFHKPVSKTYRPENYICCLLISVPFWYLILRMCS